MLRKPVGSSQSHVWPKTQVLEIHTIDEVAHVVGYSCPTDKGDHSLGWYVAAQSLNAGLRQGGGIKGTTKTT